MKNKFVIKAFGIIAIIVLVLTAMAPIFYAFAPQYVPAPATENTGSTTDVESVTTP